MTGVYNPPRGDEINDEDAVNTNNNALDKEEKEDSDYVSHKKRSLKYQMAPWAPVGQLFVVIYGDCGKTGLLPLMFDEANDAERFQPGNVDCFKVMPAFTDAEIDPSMGSLDLTQGFRAFLALFIIVTFSQRIVM